MRSLADLDVPVALRGHHRRCLDAMARLAMAVDDPGGSPAHAPGALAARALAEVRAATRVLLAARTGAGRNAPVTRFLACRLDRLALVADDIAAACAARDTAALRRGVVRFRALVGAMWKVQLAVGRGTYGG
ncbi:hypothetical protein Acsp03_68530 [Actinomadura sp. NBRC 104412]|uniref:hypothetical protein n=1 Tax=Actinomadura sp. NBRC 104412 TaxID=3032203 RepID=UPI0024A219F2|nr:hypothetical protein [Actinomadura sp. NBRC 104412]GLZ09387.1 hypothetical protein Acsp03_68530 [Actinomadura sp. NBRC 104412]